MAMTHQRVREAFDACLVIVNRYGGTPAPKRMEDAQLRVFELGKEAAYAHLAFCCTTGKELVVEAAARQKTGFMMLEVDASPLAGEEMLLKSKSKMEKAMRWLGFVQGALWGLAACNLEELKKMNMPPSEDFDGVKV